MRKIAFITCWFEWTWWWRIASILENYFSKENETITLIWFHDNHVFNVLWKKLYLWRFWNKYFPWRWWIAIIPHIINTIRFLYKEKPDIVIWIWSYCNFLWLIAQKFLKIKLLLTQHEHITTKISSDATMLDKIEFKIIKKLINNNKIVCVSKEVMEDTIKYYNLSKEQAITIYNWLDIEWIKKLWEEEIDIKEKYIINIWSFDDRKNQEMLLKAYTISEMKNKYKLVLLGDGPKKEYLKNLAKELWIERNLIFTGFAKNPYKYLSKASLFCFTSFSEALPTVLIESLILEVPVLTVPVMWSKEILDDWNCWIIAKDWDIETYSKLLDKHIKNNNSETIKKWYKYAKENFETSVMIENYKKVINNIL